MPEGDTIHRTAAALRRSLAGHRLTRVELSRVAAPWPHVGATVDRVEARGKHLLLATSDGLTIHTHQRMTGSWHLYRPRERWRKSPRAARVVLGVTDVVAVCFASPVVEVLTDRDLARHPQLRMLGPDLCDPDADIDAATTRMERFCPPERTIGEVLLDQRVACGIGNVYRSEVSFLHGIDPATALQDIDEHTRRGLLVTAARLLQDNLVAGDRTTVPGQGPGRLWAYGRAGEPCRRCATPIERDHLGIQARVIFRCPTCQPPVAPGPITSRTP
ncbi:MAG: Fpg/Nei family DNA glycosylase [Intrasporangiaceae bacterium]|nr:Fpg/Nei family DNA glycosylase [Intrasporangiaceae bacterium]